MLLQLLLSCAIGDVAARYTYWSAALVLARVVVLADGDDDGGGKWLCDVLFFIHGLLCFAAHGIYMDIIVRVEAAANHLSASRCSRTQSHTPIVFRRSTPP